VRIILISHSRLTPCFSRHPTPSFQTFLLHVTATACSWTLESLKLVRRICSGTPTLVLPACRDGSIKSWNAPRYPRGSHGLSQRFVCHRTGPLFCPGIELWTPWKRSRFSMLCYRSLYGVLRTYNTFTCRP
jgi:hypothetical protein